MHLLYCHAIIRPLDRSRKLFVYGLVHTQFFLFFNTLFCPRNFCELVILCVLLFYAQITNNHRGSVTKSCTPTLRGQGDPKDPKVSQPF